MIQTAIERPTLPLWPDVGKLLGLGRSSVYEAARRNEIPTLRFGSRVVVPTAALRKMLGLDAENDEGRALKPGTPHTQPTATADSHAHRTSVLGSVITDQQLLESSALAVAALETDELVWLWTTIQSGEARRIRERSGLTLRQMAPSLGVDPSTLARWESGHRPRTGAAARYARALKQIERQTGAEVQAPVSAWSHRPRASNTRR